MSGLFGTISIALSAIRAQQGAIAGTSNNIANINTPGYSRQQPIFREGDPVFSGNVRVGSGVELVAFRSIRDDILELRQQEERQQQGQLGATLDAMKQVETLFPADGTGLDQQLSKFFNSVATLSGDPANLALRQSVITAGQNLASAFRVTTDKLQGQQSDLDTQIKQSVAQVNQLAAQIADLNSRIASVLPGSSEAGTFVDQRNQLVQQLSELIDVTTIRTESSISLTTANGISLVVGDHSYQLGTQPDSTGRVQVTSNDQILTAEIQSGQL
ncbi:MAG TPA: flagellar hook-associated protein FlgK, partial [Terriglobales bacterium]|nr:flagellar hook-associated protein FlgK [Terriglobales bacterium]